MAVSVRNTFLHFADEESHELRLSRERRLRSLPASVLVAAALDAMTSASGGEAPLSGSEADVAEAEAQPERCAKPGNNSEPSTGDEAEDTSTEGCSVAPTQWHMHAAWWAGLCAQRERRTTVVLRNLPLNYNRKMLLRMLDCEGFAGKYNFVYLPLDFKTRAGFGYAFINLTSPVEVPRFWNTFDGFSNWMFRSWKVCQVSWSEPLQGLQAHINRYRNSPLMHESVPDEYKPVLFVDGVRSNFPPPTRQISAPAQPAAIKSKRRKQRRSA